MVQSKTLRPDWLPAVALSAALAAAMLAWNPQVGDLAAQVFRTELFQRGGLAIWNGSWYGGHYTLTYSVLFPPLAALLGPAGGRGAAVISSSYLFDRLVRDRWGEAARWATLWFAAGVVTLLADGQLTFALGVAFGLGGLRAMQLGRGAPALPPPRPAARSPARSPPPSSPASSPSARSSAAAAVNRAAAWVAAIALGLVLIPNLAFPEPGQFPFSFSSYIAIPLWCGSAPSTSPAACAARSASCAGCSSPTCSPRPLVWLAPNPMGGNAVRLGALFGGPVLAAVVLARRPRRLRSGSSPSSWPAASTGR